MKYLYLPAVRRNSAWPAPARIGPHVLNPRPLTDCTFTCGRGARVCPRVTSCGGRVGCKETETPCTSAVFIIYLLIYCGGRAREFVQVQTFKLCKFNLLHLDGLCISFLQFACASSDTFHLKCINILAARDSMFSLRCTFPTYGLHWLLHAHSEPPCGQ